MDNSTLDVVPLDDALCRLGYSLSLVVPVGNCVYSRHRADARAQCGRDDSLESSPRADDPARRVLEFCRILRHRRHCRRLGFACGQLPAGSWILDSFVFFRSTPGCRLDCNVFPHAAHRTAIRHPGFAKNMAVVMRARIVPRDGRRVRIVPRGGQRVVATGGAQQAQWRSETRGAGTRTHFRPGRGGGFLSRQRGFCPPRSAHVPSPLAGRITNHSHLLRVPLRPPWRTSLHPWLHSPSPPGKTCDVRTLAR